MDILERRLEGKIERRLVEERKVKEKIIDLEKKNTRNGSRK